MKIHDDLNGHVPLPFLIAISTSVFEILPRFALVLYLSASLTMSETIFLAESSINFSITCMEKHFSIRCLIGSIEFDDMPLEVFLPIKIIAADEAIDPN